MDPNLQAVMLFQHHQTTTPFMPHAPGVGAAAFSAFAAPKDPKQDPKQADPDNEKEEEEENSEEEEPDGEKH